MWINKHWNTTHGEGKVGETTIEYKTWGSMRTRCNNPKDKGWKNYGSRGIKVCKEWDSYSQFLKDMGRKPKGLTLERVDNNKGYSKDNCKWIPRKEQYSNQRKNVFYNGEIADHASKRLGGCRGLVHSRLKAGWSKIKAFNTPLNKRKKLKRKSPKYIIYTYKDITIRHKLPLKYSEFPLVSS